MSKQLFPSDIVDNSIEKFVAKHHLKTHLIYNIVLILIIIAVALTFIIHIDINVNSQGIIKSPGERVVIGSPYSALIENIYVTENQCVKKEEVLLILNTDRTIHERHKYQDRIIDVNNYVTDLKSLLTTPKDYSESLMLLLKTGFYAKSRNYYLSQMTDLTNRLRASTLNYTRNKLLLTQRAIAPAEFEPIEAEYYNTLAAIDLFYDKQISQWRTELDNYIIEQRDLLVKVNQLNIQIKEGVVRSPIKGIIQRIEGVHNGSYVQQGQNIFVIAPDSTLYVECMIPPKDIGYIKKGQTIRMQVDAFNYNQWGLAEGEIIEIFHDVTIVQSTRGDIPFFKVLCSLKTKHLELKNGYKGLLKRGMTVNARFKITERTIFQLLYDKADDWLNPNNNSQDEDI